MIKAFNRNEKKALIAILKFIINADGKIEEAEIGKLNSIAEKKGFDDFTEIFAEVDSEIQNIEDLQKFIASNIISETHKYDILKLAFEISAIGTIVPEEAEIIKLIGKEWNIDVPSVLKGE